MFNTAPRPFAGLDSALDHLLTLTFSSGAPFGSATPAELMAALQRLQQLANLVSTAEQQLLAQAIATDAFEDFGAASTADLLVGHLHVDRSEAHARVRRAKKSTPRTTPHRAAVAAEAGSPRRRPSRRGGVR